MKFNGIEFAGVVVCDDVRREDTGKELLIGVYSSELSIVAVPINIRLNFWLMVHCEIADRYLFTVRVRGPNDAQLVIGDIELNIPKPDSESSVNVGPLLIQVQSEGYLSLDIRSPDQEWREMKRLPVRVMPSGTGA